MSVGSSPVAQRSRKMTSVLRPVFLAFHAVRSTLCDVLYRNKIGLSLSLLSLSLSLADKNNNQNMVWLSVATCSAPLGSSFSKSSFPARLPRHPFLDNHRGYDCVNASPFLHLPRKFCSGIKQEQWSPRRRLIQLNGKVTNDDLLHSG